MIRVIKCQFNHPIIDHPRMCPESCGK